MTVGEVPIVLITREIVTRFEAEIRNAEGKAARLEITGLGLFQKLSSIQPLHARLKQSIGRELSWDDIKNLVAAIPVDKQQRFSAALKYLQKLLQGHGSHMFETLKEFGTKISKSQQRYILPMLNADPKVTADQRKNADTRGEAYRDLSPSDFQKASLRTTRCEEIDGRYRVVFYVDGFPA